MSITSIIGWLGGRRWLPGVLAVAAVAFLALAPPPALAPTVERLGYLLFDQYQRVSPRPYQDAGVKIVDIDEESIRRVGQWPWPRTLIATLNDRLTGAGAATIAYDIVFSEPDRMSPPRLAAMPGLDSTTRKTLARLPDSDAALAEAFGRSNVVIGTFLTHESYRRPIAAKAGFAVSGSAPRAVGRFEDAVAPIGPLERSASGIGFVTITPDSDAIVRRAPLVARVGGTLLPSLSLEALRVAQGAGSITLKTSDASGEVGAGRSDMVALKVGQFQVPTSATGELWIHYAEPRARDVIPAWRILTGDVSDSDLKQAVEGRIVFVGAGAIGLRDLVSTPVRDRELGVNVHAQAAAQMITGQFLIRPDWAPGIEITLLLLLGVGLAVLLPWIGALRGALVGIMAIGTLFLASWLAFTRLHFLLDPTWPAIGVATAWLVQTVLTFYREERQRAYIHRAFDRYLSPELVRRIADNPGLLELGGLERDMSVLFCDIRNFSRLSERMSAPQVIDFLVRFLTPMTDVLLEHGATIDKYIGDAILAFWNAPLDDPDHHRHAARAALAMQARLTKLNSELRERPADHWPGDIQIGIGLNSGNCCVGNIGSQRRLSYSLIGDPVNLASRLEGLTKTYGVPVLVGDRMAKELGEFALVTVDRVRVVGRDRPETIHALVGDEEVAASASFRRFAEVHQQMLEAYFARDFERADALNRKNAKGAARFGLAALAKLIGTRLKHFMAEPPPVDWDGVTDAKSK